MRRYCKGIGVFDSDDAKDFVLFGERNATRYHILVSLNEGETWIREFKERNYEPEDLQLINPENVAVLLTKFGHNLPDRLVDQLSESAD